MVDIEQHGVEFPARRFGIEPLFRCGGESKKIGVNEAAARVGHKLRAERDQSALVPLDHRLERFDDNERLHGWILQGRECGVAEPETADNDIELRRGQRSQPEIGERDFHVVEEARHKKVVAKFYLKDLKAIKRQKPPATQRQFAQRGLAVIEFGEVGAH